MNDIAPPMLLGSALCGAVDCVVHVGQFGRVIFGAGAADLLPEYVAAGGFRRALILATPGRRAAAEEIAKTLGNHAIGVCAEARKHSPVAISDSVADEARNLEADLLISVGGGSAIGLGKALSLRTGLKQFALPTTYSGSELTPIIGQTKNGIKETSRSDVVRPSMIFYDPRLSCAVPARLSAASGMNALAHAIEALYMSDDRTVGEIAMAAIGHLRVALPAIISTPANLPARSRALYGAWLAGFCLAETPMALHHKLCHVVGGVYDLDHAETHAVLLPHSLAYNSSAVPRAYHRLKGVLGELPTEPADALFDLLEELRLPSSLRAIGMPEEGVDRVARLACENAYANPRPLEPEGIRSLLARAWAGDRPFSRSNDHA